MCKASTPGQVITGRLERSGKLLMTAEITLNAQLDPDDFNSPLPANWLGFKMIPSIEADQSPAVHQLVVSCPQRVTLGAVWHADGHFSLGNELGDFRPREVVSADYIEGTSLWVGYGRILEDLREG